MIYISLFLIPLCALGGFFVGRQVIHHKHVSRYERILRDIENYDGNIDRRKQK